MDDCIHCINGNAGPVQTGCFNINQGITHTMSQMPGKMGRFDVKNEEKAPSDANKRGKRFGSGNTVRRESFSGTSEVLNTLQVKFDCVEGN